MSRIKFIKNWNNKLNCDYFTSVRLKTEKNLGYYHGGLNEEWDVLLNDVNFGKASLVSISIKALTDFTYIETYLDAGLKYVDFFELMEKMYSNKPEWKGFETDMIILLFKKIR